jgi:methyl-accepting chemotaxis protein
MTLKTKLLSSFGIVLLMLASILGAFYFTLSSTTEKYDRLMSHEIALGELANAAQAALLQCRRQEKDFLLEKDRARAEKFDHHIGALKKDIIALAEVARKVGKGDAIELSNLLGAHAEEYDKTFKELVSLHTARGLDESAGVQGEFRKAVHRLEEMFAKSTTAEAEVLLLQARRNEKDYMLRGNEKYIKKVNEYADKLGAVLEQSTSDAATFKDLIAAYKTGFDALVGIDRKIQANADRLKSAAHQIEPAVDQIHAMARNLADQQSSDTREDAFRLSRLAVGIGIAAILLAVFLAFYISLSITKMLNRVIDGLREGSEQVAAAAAQVSSSSQSLAGGSSEQAASIEETTSSLEEISSMTRQNADHAQQANSLMSQTKQVVATANDSMQQLTVSMGEISKASEETSKIVKTIDEIAFQTNLLALNAAVEAARAGEAGAGFAVVADEVRNLAMRAAEAAKNTSNLIEGTVKKVKDGTEVVARTNEAFQQVAGSSAKAADLVAEIAAASKEQSQGISQINTAVTEMDKLTQQNAANAEESASASEELSSQAEQMQGMVGELVAVVGGSSGADRAESGKGHHPRTGVKGTHNAISAAMSKLKKAGPAKKSKEPVAEAVIPLDDKDFSDF